MQGFPETTHDFQNFDRASRSRHGCRSTHFVVAGVCTLVGALAGEAVNEARQGRPTPLARPFFKAFSNCGHCGVSEWRHISRGSRSAAVLGLVQRRVAGKLARQRADGGDLSAVRVHQTSQQRAFGFHDERRALRVCDK